MGMLQFFSRLLADEPRSNPRASAPAAMVRPELVDTVKVSVESIVGHQLALLGFEWGEVSLDEDDVGRRSCGYILGLVQGVLNEFAELQPSSDEFVVALAKGFAAVHGRVDSRIGLQTIYLQEAEEQHVMEGLRLAYRDVQAVYSGSAFAVPNGLFLIHNADEEALRSNLAALAS
jgi:hypothetical protein